MPVRFLSSFFLAAGVTFGLFWVMQALISAEAELDEVAAGRVVDFVRLKRDESTEEKKRELPDKVKPEEPPPPPDLNLSQNENPDSDLGDVMAIATTDIDLGGAPTLGAGAGDQDLAQDRLVHLAGPPRVARHDFALELLRAPAVTDDPTAGHLERLRAEFGRDPPRLAAVAVATTRFAAFVATAPERLAQLFFEDHLHRFQHAHRVPRFGQMQCSREAGEAAADNGDLGLVLTGQWRAGRCRASCLGPQARRPATGVVRHGLLGQSRGRSRAGFRAW